MKIYVASSWRNPHQPSVVNFLRSYGHEVYDFRNPAPDNNGFHWSAIDPDWQSWSNAQFHGALKHPVAIRGFMFDMDALRSCDACVLVLPCGKPAHLELGWAAGQRKFTVVLQTGAEEPELMYKMCSAMACGLTELAQHLASYEETFLATRTGAGAR